MLSKMTQLVTGARFPDRMLRNLESTHAWSFRDFAAGPVEKGMPETRYRQCRERHASWETETSFRERVEKMPDQKYLAEELEHTLI